MCAIQSIKDIEKISLEILKDSKSLDVFPTPIDRIVSYVDLKVSSNIDISQIHEGYKSKYPDALLRALSKVRGLLDRKEKKVYLDLTQLDSRKNFVKLHEVGHDVLPWQQRCFDVLDDDDESLKLDTREEFEAEASKIFNILSFFSKNLETVSFEERDTAEAAGYDIIAELKAGTLANEVWQKFATSQLMPSFTEGLPEYKGMRNGSVLFIPQKLISDGECGVTAAQQSINPQVFTFLKEAGLPLVLGQHFHKVNDLQTVQNLAKDFNLYVPGMTENNEVLGIRGVAHEKYYNMYASLSASVGIAGTHTWILLTMFPNIPQIILFNKKGVENWKAIAQAYQANGKKIIAIGFDESTDLQELSTEIKKAYNSL